MVSKQFLTQVKHFYIVGLGYHEKFSTHYKVSYNNIVNERYIVNLNT